MLRILHTADNHIGKTFRNRSYSSDTREALIEERFLALRRTVDIANAQKVHFIVISGDLFDRISMPVRDIQRVISILSHFDGEAVLILPGNHDFFERTSDGLWATFRQHCSDDRICVLQEQQIATFLVGEQRVNFYPAPCRSKHSTTHALDWIIETRKNPEALNIGIAHGNVEGFGFPGDRYFPMTVAELESAGMDTWLLGHIHVPYPVQASSIAPAFFYPASHTPEDVNCTHQGHCWMLEFGQEKQVRMEQLTTGALRFYRLYHRITSLEDVGELEQMLRQLPAGQSLVWLEVAGQASEEELQQIHHMLDQYRGQLLHLEVDCTVTLRIDRAHIDQHFVQDTLPHRLLSGLAAQSEMPLALQFAYQLIQDINA